MIFYEWYIYILNIGDDEEKEDEKNDEENEEED